MKAILDASNKYNESESWYTTKTVDRRDDSDDFEKM